MSAVIENHHDDHHHGPAKGITRWLYTTNHKDIGTLYLWFSFAMFLIGGAMAMVIRAELFQPGMQIVEPEFYNQMITLHGLIMIFGGVMPAFVAAADATSHAEARLAKPSQASQSKAIPWWIPNPKHRTQNPKSQMPSPKSQIQS